MPPNSTYPPVPRPWKHGACNEVHGKYWDASVFKWADITAKARPKPKTKVKAKAKAEAKADHKPVPRDIVMENLNTLLDTHTDACSGRGYVQRFNTLLETDTTDIVMNHNTNTNAPTMPKDIVKESMNTLLDMDKWIRDWQSPDTHIAHMSPVSPQSPSSLVSTEVPSDDNTACTWCPEHKRWV
jgi:hypothetical protein